HLHWLAIGDQRLAQPELRMRPAPDVPVQGHVPKFVPGENVSLTVAIPIEAERANHENLRKCPARCVLDVAVADPTARCHPGPVMPRREGHRVRRGFIAALLVTPDERAAAAAVARP